MNIELGLQLASISYATRALFLGSTLIFKLKPDTRRPDLSSFVEVPIGFNYLYITSAWEDVLKGIEEVSHNITAALLTLDLGTNNSTCYIDQQGEVYQYNSFALWVPYGVSNTWHLFTLIL